MSGRLDLRLGAADAGRALRRLGRRLAQPAARFEERARAVDLHLRGLALPLNRQARRGRCGWQRERAAGDDELVGRQQGEGVVDLDFRVRRDDRRLAAVRALDRAPHLEDRRGHQVTSSAPSLILTDDDPIRTFWPPTLSSIPSESIVIVLPPDSLISSLPPSSSRVSVWPPGVWRTNFLGVASLGRPPSLCQPPAQTGRLRSPASNSTQTPAPTGGTA